MDNSYILVCRKLDRGKIFVLTAYFWLKTHFFMWITCEYCGKLINLIFGNRKINKILRWYFCEKYLKQFVLIQVCVKIGVSSKIIYEGELL